MSLGSHSYVCVCGWQSAAVCLKKMTSNTNQTTFQIKHHLTYQSSYVIYLIECAFGLQYVGRTIQPPRCRLNQHRHNIQKPYPKYSVSRHCANTPEKETHQIKITPIDYIPYNPYNRLSLLQKREIYWIYQLNTFMPEGLNEIQELIV